MHKHIVVLDFETTGTFENRIMPRPIEIGALKVDPYTMEILGSFESLIYTQTKLDDFIVDFTGITNEMLTGPDAQPLQDVFEDFEDFCEGDKAVLASWPISFEMSILQHTYTHMLGRLFPLDRRGIDIGTLYQSYLIKSASSDERKRWDNTKFSLDDACRHFGVDIEERHRALADTRGEYKILKRLLK